MINMRLLLLAGDALQNERARTKRLESTTAELQQRISNMASVRELSNKHLSSQLDRLRSQLEASKRRQQESAAQVGGNRAGSAAEHCGCGRHC